MRRFGSIERIYSYNTDNVYNFNHKVLDFAEKNAIPVFLSRLTESDIEQMNELGVDVLVVAAYAYKIPTKNMHFKAVNVHPTQLPFGRGVWPLPDVILKDCRSSAVTIHKLTDQIDAGPILYQESFDLDSNYESLETLSFKSRLAAVKCMNKVLADVDGFWERSKPQNIMPEIPFPSEALMTIDFSSSVEEISRKARAFGKLESCFQVDGRSYVARDIQVWRETHDFDPGSLVMSQVNELLFAAKDGFAVVRFFDKDMD
jgi:methionyl-tRNA formyltransferase